MARAWRYRNHLRDEQALGAWITTIVRREAHRAHASSPNYLLTDVVELPIAAVLDEIDLAETRADIEAGLGRLCSHEQELLKLRYGSDLTQEAIARRLGLPEGTVKVQLHRARKNLRAALEG